MSKILNGSLNLEKLIHAKVKTKKGNNAISIPVNENFLVTGQKGTYLNLTVFVNDEKDDYGNIASIKQNGAVAGKKWSELTEQEQAKIKSLPYLGNLAANEASTGYEDVEEADEVIDGPDNEMPF